MFRVQQAARRAAVQQTQVRFGHGQAMCWKTHPKITYENPVKATDALWIGALVTTLFAFNRIDKWRTSTNVAETALLARKYGLDTEVLNNKTWLKEQHGFDYEQELKKPYGY